MNIPGLDVPTVARLGCIAIGNFDGVHKGHAEMLRSLRDLADDMHAPAVAVTFDPHPISVLRPEFTPPILTTLKDRVELLRASGAQQVVVLPVTPQLLEISAEVFFEDVILRQFAARGIVEGANFHFGKDRRGDVQLLQDLCSRHDVSCRIVQPVNDAETMISSSRIRELICSRAMAHAVDLLGHPYRLTGVVRSGAGRGRKIGFPTANIAEIVTLLPAHGVYAGVTSIEGRRYPAAISVGPNPTFGEHREKIECHIDGFAGDLYNQTLAIDLLAEIRPLQSFASVDQLIQQITADVASSRRIALDWMP